MLKNDKFRMDLNSTKWKSDIPEFKVITTKKYNERPYVSIIVSVYNKAKFLNKTMLSLFNQTIGKENLEIIVVDDKSTDESVEILSSYISSEMNLKIVLFNENTGTPAAPRNAGILLAKGKYVMIVDADDWLDAEGVKCLYDKLESSGDHYAVGRTIEVNDKGSFLFAEYESNEERTNFPVEKLYNPFGHMGPRSRLMRRDLLIDNNIHFPSMRYSEDKKFYYDVIASAGKISTVKSTVTYLNRYSSNDESLVTQTSVFDKMATNIEMLKYTIESPYSDVIKKAMIRRVFEFDGVTRLFKRHHFVKSEEKSKYFECFEKMIRTVSKSHFDVTELFKFDFTREIYRLATSHQESKIVDLVNWQLYSQEKITKLVGNQFYQYSLIEGIQPMRINLKAIGNYVNLDSEGNVNLSISVYGDVSSVKCLQLRDRNDFTNSIDVKPTNVHENEFIFKIRNDQFFDLKNSKYSVYLIYNDSDKVTIQASYIDDQLVNQFYWTQYYNLGVEKKASITSDIVVDNKSGLNYYSDTSVATIKHEDMKDFEASINYVVENNGVIKIGISTEAKNEIIGLRVINRKKENEFLFLPVVYRNHCYIVISFNIGTFNQLQNGKYKLCS
ncbi:glycosyltransferase family 2 protein [Leuconostoc mesenteroides subsp. jonggajibkimchii]|uniref:glycosyltransferase family 2 protein n=1 Tax=Leuconostoc mesenteroides TaxID=1245 RepID=UPI003CEF80E8